MLTMNLGIVLSYTIGAFFNYNALPIFGIIVGIIFIIWMAYLPETPLYLYSQQKIKAAELSADFYNYEINPNDIAEKSDNKSGSNTNSISWKEIGTDK